MAPLPQLLPSERTVHVPLLPWRSQAWQPLSQVVSQQTPWAQCPEAHCSSFAQASPMGRSPSQRFCALQNEPGTQSLLLLQVVAHAVPVHCVYGAHDVCAPGVQVPVPSQVACAVTMPLVQL